MFYNTMQWLVKFYLFLFYRIKVHGDLNLLNENVLICPNHCSYLDPVLIKNLTFRPIYYMAKKEIFKNKIFDYFLSKLKAFPVDRKGNDLRAMMNAVKLIKGGDLLCIFIEGTRVKEFNLDNAKAGAVLIAHLAKVDILPIFIRRKTYKFFDTIEIFIRDKFILPDLDYKDKSKNNYAIVAKSVLTEIYGDDYIERA